MNCHLCERNCGVNRYEQTGFCKANHHLIVARAALHYWEEPCLSGETGSGAIFFSNCSLKCLFCQNYQISSQGIGKEISIERLTTIMLELQDQQAHNINLVTPTHYVPSLIKAITLAREKGLKLPIVYNTGNYETLKTIESLNGLVDIYLPDLKYFDSQLGKKYSGVNNYFDVASRNLDAMLKQVGKPQFSNGIMQKGVIVRILVLPGHINDAKNIIKYLYQKYHDDIYMSIMNQYTPVNECPYPNLNRKLTDEEYDEVINYAYDLGVRRAFIQEGDTVKESFIPLFDLTGV